MSKSSAIAVFDHEVPKGSPLWKSEHELAEAMIDEAESYFRQGEILERIKENKEFRDAGYDSFESYMDDRMPLGMGRRHADRLIKAKDVRLLLPILSDKKGPDGPVWTEAAIRPLTHKDFTPSDQRRLGKKIATRIKRGELLTAKLVKQLCDEDRGVERKKREKKSREVVETPTAAETLQNMEREVELWQSSLGKVPGGFWEDAEADDPGCTKRLIQALSDLASFLRS